MTDAALSDGRQSIRDIGKRMKVDVPKAFDYEGRKTVTDDLKAYLRVCKALNWSGTPDPAVHGPGVNYTP